MSGATKKVFERIQVCRAHPEMSSASKKVIWAHPRKFFERIQVCRAHPRMSGGSGASKKVLKRIQERKSSASKKAERIQESRAHPRKFFGRIQEFYCYTLLVKVKLHKQLRRNLCPFKACERVMEKLCYLPENLRRFSRHLIRQSRR
jgi:hypothetical protein